MRQEQPQGLTSLNISLPHSMKSFIEEQLAIGGFSTPSEYVRALIRDAQARTAEKRLEELLLQGLDSGKPVEMNPKEWQTLKERVRQRAKRRTNT